MPIRLLFVGIYSAILQGQTQLEVFLPDGSPCEGAIVAIHSVLGIQLGLTDTNGFFFLAETSDLQHVTVTKPGFLGIRKTQKHLADGQTQFTLMDPDFGDVIVLADWIEIPFIPKDQPYCGGGAVAIPIITQRVKILTGDPIPTSLLPMNITFSANFNRDGTISQIEIRDPLIPAPYFPLLEQAIKETTFLSGQN